MRKTLGLFHDSYRCRIAVLFLLFSISCVAASGQSSGFTYQGKLIDGGAPANGSYDVQFSLFDAASGTGQVGSTLTLNSVQVAAGIFTVELDFGSAAFSGADRFLEIGVRPAAQGGFTILSPRQKLGSSPYSVKSVNSATAENSLNLGGTAASQFVQTNDPRMTDARPPLPGSNDYVRNSNASQAGVNFSVGGTGTAGTLNAATQYNLGGNRILSNTGTNNLFAGVGSGPTNTASNNAFFGHNAGQANTTGQENAFFGTSAASSNITGPRNAVFGFEAGRSMTDAGGNSFFGWWAGRNNTAGGNSFFGSGAGRANTTGVQNAFFGASAGFNNTTGGGNAFFGSGAGSGNTTGAQNAIFGEAAGTVNSTGSFNSFFGQSAGNNNTGSNNSFFGTAAGNNNTTGGANTFIGRFAGLFNSTGSNNTFVGNGADFSTVNPTGINNTLLGTFTKVASGVNFSTAIGEGAQVTQSDSLILGRSGVRIGIGTSAPAAKIHVRGGQEFRFEGPFNGNDNVAFMSFGDGVGTAMGYIGDGSSTDRNMYLASYVADVIIYTPIGAALTATSNGNILMTGGPNLLGPTLNTYAAQTFDTGNFKGLFTPNLFLTSLDTFLPSPVHVCARVQTIGTGAGGWALTRCSTPFSSANDKSDIQSFSGGMDIIRRLNPVSFRRKSDNAADIGLNSNEVAEVAPQLVTINEKGEAENVKENGLSLVFINAFKEQQKQIDAQAEQIKQQQKQIDVLKKLVCMNASTSEACKEN